jgi:hypothetical protein
VRANLAKVMTGVQDAIRQRGHELLGIPGVVGEAVRPSLAAGLIASDRTVVRSVFASCSALFHADSADGEVVVVQANPVKQYER